MLRFDEMINHTNEQVGRLTAFLVIPLVAVVIYEVFARYLFNAPTVWAFEVTTFIYGIHYMVGLGYTLKQQGHVSIDIVEATLPAKTRAILRIIVGFILFLPTVGFLAYGSVRYALNSWQSMERASTSWAPLLAPYKTFMAIGFILLLAQGIAAIVQNWRELRQLSTNSEGDDQ